VGKTIEEIRKDIEQYFQFCRVINGIECDVDEKSDDVVKRE